MFVNLISVFDLSLELDFSVKSSYYSIYVVSFGFSVFSFSYLLSLQIVNKSNLIIIPLILHFFCILLHWSFLSCFLLFLLLPCLIWFWAQTLFIVRISIDRSFLILRYNGCNLWRYFMLIMLIWRIGRVTMCWWLFAFNLRSIEYIVSCLDFNLLLFLK